MVLGSVAVLLVLSFFDCSVQDFNVPNRSQATMNGGFFLFIIPMSGARKTHKRHRQLSCHRCTSFSRWVFMGSPTVAKFGVFVRFRAPLHRIHLKWE
jgi:hypothetical protein